jgi:hypothetical protein
VRFRPPGWQSTLPFEWAVPALIEVKVRRSPQYRVRGDRSPR